MADDQLSAPLNNGSVASRFVSQKDIEKAKEVRDEQWKAAYARLGQEPPAPKEDPEYDGRSLFDKLAQNKAAKQEEWESKSKLSAQFRPLDADEINFLDSVTKERLAADRKRKADDDDELQSFHEAIAAKVRQADPPPIIGGNSTKVATDSSPSSSSVKPKTPAPTANVMKKPQKDLLKGIVVKKKKSAAAKETKDVKDDSQQPPPAKKQKTD
ncbi:N-terminal domain of NEFA-interacting nuclear protein NIP30-domain-containing protein [Auriculariales sp. MPI-PUGE-AT-0066]|nr:N-terminal domain of NEFA-interacting nuclear protein NIP30-domain-containing protein [Auriculariales sp. MPI-PUGE-AT-0066]